MFMMKANGVAQFMDDYSKLFAVPTYGDGLATVAILAQKGAATKGYLNYRKEILTR